MIFKTFPELHIVSENKECVGLFLRKFDESGFHLLPKLVQHGF